MLCDRCSAEAVVMVPGSAPVGIGELFLVNRGEPTRCFCLEHAIEIGRAFPPYAMEKAPKTSRRKHL